MVQLIKKLYHDKRIRFLFVGVMNTAVGYGFYALFIFMGLNPYIATTLSTIIGIINSYFWNKYFTFRKPKKSFAEAVRFVLVYLISYAVNLGLVYLFVDLCGMNSYISGIICLFFTTVISYFGHNFFSFKEANHPQLKEKGES